MFLKLSSQNRNKNYEIAYVVMVMSVLPKCVHDISKGKYAAQFQKWGTLFKNNEEHTDLGSSGHDNRSLTENSKVTKIYESEIFVSIRTGRG